MPVLVADDLKRSYGTRVVLDGVSLAIDASERVGLVGTNGSGKSTLARILAGTEEPDEGRVALRSGARVEVFEQNPTLNEDDDARMAAKRGAPVPDHEVDAMLSRLGIQDPTQSIREMSGGQKRRVALARALVADADLTILDEPTNHLDVHTIEWLEKHLTRPKAGAALIITHDRYFLDRVCQRTAEISRARLHLYPGGYESYLTGKAERQAHEQRAEQNRQNTLRRELEWLRRGPKARTTKQKARVDRAHELINAEAPTHERTAEMAFRGSESGDTVLEVEDLRLDYGGEPLIDGFSLIVTKGERIGIVGRNGAGKSTLLSTILGNRDAQGGTVRLGKRTKANYLDQARTGLDAEKSISENVAGRGGQVFIDGRDVDVRAYMERFLFDSTQLRQPVSSLSGGERTRVLLAKMLLNETNLLVLDEPTNDLDTATLSALEEQLVSTNATCLIVTHDRYFLDRVATSILAFEPNGTLTKYAGNYSDYVTQNRRSTKGAKSARDSKRSADKQGSHQGSRAPVPKKKKLTYAERLELEALPQQIEEAEASVVVLETQLADPEFYRSRAEEAPRLTAELADTKSTVEKLMARWVELEEKKG